MEALLIVWFLIKEELVWSISFFSQIFVQCLFWNNFFPVLMSSQSDKMFVYVYVREAIVINHKVKLENCSQVPKPPILPFLGNFITFYFFLTHPLVGKFLTTLNNYIPVIFDTWFIFQIFLTFLRINPSLIVPNWSFDLSFFMSIPKY